ncbi:MAG: nitroreductase family protein [candidate division Zixibacteria bacterium]|nr:nitroreductase family protein [candidate division Zixibacteria bacterium]
MSGIVFLRTSRIDTLRDFYLDRVGCQLWLDQGDCVIFRHGNLLFGFCERDESDRQGLLTFFYDTQADVDAIYRSLQSVAVSPPVMNEKYRIYHFFAHDPDGRQVEFQTFDHPIDSYLSGETLLLTRRSIRQFKRAEVPAEILRQVLDISRFAPTSRNSQPYYFKVIGDRETLRFLSQTRGGSSAPIACAPMAVAVCSDPELSKRHIQDACIAAYHLLLAAWFYGLGTCWIAAMDRQDVKTRLDIPQSHYIATITPLGYPDPPLPAAPPRKELAEFIRE